MKVFLAIVAAAAVIIGYLRAQARLDGWNAAINQSNREVTLLLREIDDYTRAFKRAGSAGEMNAVSEAKDNRFAEIEHRYDDLYWLLQNKPFRLPLTANEKKDLESVIRTRQRFRDEREKTAGQEAALRVKAAPIPGDWRFDKFGGRNPLNRRAYDRTY